MLGALRGFVTGWTAKILLILLVASFALWGITGSILSGGDTTSVAAVGETKVPVREFLSAYNRNMNEVQQRAGRRLTRDEARIFGVEQRALGNVVAWATLDEFARVHGLALSDKQLAQMIAENPAFHDSTGSYNRETFRQAVFQAQMRESDFIEAQNASAVRSQLTRSFADGPILPDTFKAALANYAQEQRVFEYLTITPAIAGEPAAPTAEQLKTYFEANKANYAAPEYRKLDLLSLRPEDLAASMEVSDEEIEADYQARISRYQEPERRRVQQIVFPSREAAEAAKKSLEEGAFFETVVAEADRTMADADLGLMAKDALPAHLQDPAFGLEVNAISDVIDGPFGSVIVRVTEVNEARTTPLDEVKDTIKNAMALERAASRITSLSEEIEDSRAGGSSLAEAAPKFDLKIRSVEVDARGRTPDGTQLTDIPQSSDLLRQAFETEVGAQASALDIGAAGFVWYDVTEIAAARDRTQDEVTERLTTDWMAAERGKMVQQKAEALKARLDGGASMRELSAEVDPSTLGAAPTTQPLNRTGTAQGFPSAATQEGFKGAEGHIAIVDGSEAGTSILLKVKEVRLPEAAAAPNVDQQVNIANEGAADDLLNQMIARLQGEYGVTQNPQTIDMALTQGR
ncbi:SurA N-terminal domain-containing protein [Ahrensia sp. R2A130]|uniref:SurA N-terminal domain-containing protein n=1 Tax=Ahrensia sp. R2A130 TaxID=744979 RepID=UPI0001E0C9A5|nr:SurA N-terminal domain-containing protein [Ahrensia sp. R2A130]EFL90254.1 peptidyl-prolyl cis-trans isomerse D [Ahrensia sp. R2A130]